MSPVRTGGLMAKMDEYLLNEMENSNSHLKKETRINRKIIFSDEYVRAIQSIGESKECSRLIIEAIRKMIKHHDGDSFEDLYFIDSESNICKSQTNYRVEHKVEPTVAMLKMLTDNPNIIAIHNHPNSMLPSLSDFYICRNRKYKYGMIACHNGNVYLYKVIGGLVDIIIETSIRIYERKELISLTSLNDANEILISHQEHINELIKNLYDAGIELKEVFYNER